MTMTSILKTAVESYSFPCVGYDFDAAQSINFSNMSEVEEYIGSKLHSSDSRDVQNGLANILYWGYAKMGIRDTRVRRFWDKVTPKHLCSFIEMTQTNVPSCSTIMKVRMPEYSGLSFISKIMMFYDPDTYCTLDNQILKMRGGGVSGSLNRLKKSPKEKLIRISKNNEREYLAWCEECRTIAENEDLGMHRAVDAERAFFALIQAGKHELAKSIYDQFFSIPDSTTI